MSLDEATFSFIPGQHESTDYLGKRGEQVSDSYVRQVHELQAPRVMVVAGMTSRGPLKARIVPSMSKIIGVSHVKRKSFKVPSFSKLIMIKRQDVFVFLQL